MKSPSTMVACVLLVCWFWLGAVWGEGLIGREWSRIWGSAGWENGTALRLDEAGGIYVCGETSGDFDGQTNLGGGSAALSKYLPSGERLWTRFWSKSNSFYTAVDIAVDTGSCVYVSCWCRKIPWWFGDRREWQRLCPGLYGRGV